MIIESKGLTLTPTERRNNMNNEVMNIQDLVKQLGLEPINLNGIKMFVPPSEKDSIEKSLKNKNNAKKISPKKLKKIFSDGVENNKSFVLDCGDFTLGKVSIVSLDKNTKTEISCVINDKFADAEFKIKKRSNGKYKIIIKDLNENGKKQISYMTRKELLWEFEYNLNGLCCYLGNKDEKIQMFPDYEPFPFTDISKIVEGEKIQLFLKGGA